MADASPIIVTLSQAKRPDGTDRPGVFRCQYKSHVIEHRSPEGRLARLLLGAGYDRTRAFQTKWLSGSLGLKWRSLGDAGAGDVNERDKGGLYWRRWEPFPSNAFEDTD